MFVLFVLGERHGREVAQPRSEASHLFTLKKHKMTRKAKALIGFSKMKDNELLIATSTVGGAMTDNPHFPTPMPTLADVQLLLDDFSAKLAIARKRGSPEDTAIKDESKVPLAEAMQQLGYYVNSVAKGHLSTVLSSGFPTNATSASAMVPLIVDSVKASDGRQSGQVRLDFAKQDNVRLYEYVYRKVQTPEEEWSDRLTTTSSRGNIIAPLELGHYYEMKVRAVNTKGAGDWSQTARILVR